MRCFVTGANGFLGAHLVRFLLERQCQVGVLVRPTSDWWRIQDLSGRLTVVTGDLDNVAEFAPRLREYAPETVFHLGWFGAARSRDDVAQINRNLRGTVDLVQALETSGCSCFVGLGSQAEYGRHDGVLGEDTCPHPESLYGAAKLCAAVLCESLCKRLGLRFVWLRLFAAYGPQDDPQYLIPSVIRSLLKGLRPSLTAGEQRLDYLFVQDAVRAIWLAGTRKHLSGIFNLGSGEATAVREIAETIRDLIDPALELGLGEVPYKPDQVMVLQADVRRLKGAAGWSPSVPLREGLLKTIEWHRAVTSAAQ